MYVLREPGIFGASPSLHDILGMSTCNRLWLGLFKGPVLRAGQSRFGGTAGDNCLFALFAAGQATLTVAAKFKESLKAGLPYASVETAKWVEASVRPGSLSRRRAAARFKFPRV